MGKQSGSVQGDTAGTCVTFDCSKSLNAEPSPVTKVPNTEMLSAGIESSAFTQQRQPGLVQEPSKTCSTPADMRTAGTGRQGRLLEMMQRARMILHGPSTQVTTTGTSLPASQASHLAAPANPTIREASRPQAAALGPLQVDCSSGRASPAVPVQQKFARPGMASRQQGSPTDPQTGTAHMSSDCQEESVLRRAIRLALHNSARRSPAHCKRKWEEFTTDAVEEKKYEQTSTAAWSHRKLESGAPFLQPKNAAAHPRLEAANMLHKGLHSNAAPSLHISDGEQLPRLQADNHALTKQHDLVQGKKSEKFPVVPGVRSADNCTVASLTRLLCKAKSTSPLPVCNVPSTDCSSTAVKTGGFLWGAAKTVPTPNGEVPSCATGETSTATWTYKQMIGTAELRATNDRQHVTSSLSGAVSCSVLGTLESPVHEFGATSVGETVRKNCTADQHEPGQGLQHQLSDTGTARDVNGSPAQLKAQQAPIHGCDHGQCPGDPGAHKEGIQVTTVPCTSQHEAENGHTTQCGRLPGVCQHAQCGQPAPVGKSLQSALGRLRKALSKSKDGDSFAKADQPRPDLDMKNTEAIIRHNEQQTTRPHAPDADQEPDSFLIMRRSTCGETSVSPACGKHTEDAARPQCELSAYPMRQLSLSGLIGKIKAGPIAEKPDPEPVSPLSPLKPSGPTSLQLPPVSGSDVRASGALLADQHLPETSGDPLAKALLSAPTPTPEREPWTQTLQNWDCIGMMLFQD